MVKIVIAIDKFKGSLSAEQVCDVVGRAIADVSLYPSEVVSIPLADGGDGSLEALACDGDMRVACLVSDPLGREIEAFYLVRKDGVAIIEMSVSVGLSRLGVEERDPEKCSSYGFGEMISHAYHVKGVRKFILTIGGSATSDCGIGMLSALGLTFMDAKGVTLEPIGASVGLISKILYSKEFGLLRQCDFTVISDVNNPLLGVNGAACVYAPQKGADGAMVERLEKGATSFTELINRDRCCDVGAIPGGGAAGGVGMALNVFLGAKILSGANFIMQYKEVERFVECADMIITGEGSVDKQTLNGKLVSEVVALASKHNKKCIVVCGIVKDGVTASLLGVDGIYSLVEDGVSQEMAIEQAADILYKKIIQIWSGEMR